MSIQLAPSSCSTSIIHAKNPDVFAGQFSTSLFQSYGYCSLLPILIEIPESPGVALDFWGHTTTISGCTNLSVKLSF